MPFDPATISPAAKDRFIALGAGFGSGDTLAQADRTLGAHGKYGDLLAGRGFGPAEATLLAGVRDALLAAGIVRNDARSSKKTTNAALLDAMFAGKKARMNVHSAIGGARLALEITGETTGVNAIDAALNATRRAGADAVQLHNQLGTLENVLKDPNVRPAVSGVEALETSVRSAATALDVARQGKSRVRGTPAETQHLDLCDGLVVELCRLARLAARAAANDLGQPAIAKEFQLAELYNATGKAEPEDPQDPPAA